MKYLLLLMFSAVCFGQEFKYPNFDEITYKSIDWKHKKPIRKELNNGMIVYMLEDHEIPLIEGCFYIKAGAVYDPKDKVGLAELTASTIRTGGTANMSPDAIDNKLEYDASEIELYATATYTYGSFSALTENFDDMSNILADMLAKPAFQQDKINVEIASMQEDIRRRNDSPINTAILNFKKKLRKNHPTGWFTTLESINELTRKDIIEFHKKYYKPNNMILAIVGDFSTDSMVNKLNTTFADWKKKEIKLPNIKDIERKPERKIFHVEKDLAQSTILIGQLSIRKQNPDVYPVQIGDYILGGSTNSWLHETVRDNEGLAYMVNSYFNPGSCYKGDFGIFCQTEAKNTVKAIELILAEVNKLLETEVDTVDFNIAKESITNKFIFTFESPFEMAATEASLEFFNMPKNYYDMYIENINKVDRKSMLEALKRCILPDKFTILVVGKSEAFSTPLSSLGKVEEIKLEQ